MIRKVARHCRELMHHARTADAKEQLRVWAEELEQQAEALKRQLPAEKQPQEAASN